MELYILVVGFGERWRLCYCFDMSLSGIGSGMAVIAGWMIVGRFGLIIVMWAVSSWPQWMWPYPLCVLLYVLSLSWYAHVGMLWGVQVPLMLP